MTAGAVVSACVACGWRGMPHRDWCPVCRAAEVRRVRAHSGVLEETTIVRKGAGPLPVRLGSVRLDGGGVVLARLEAGASEGSRVRLLDDGGAAVARPL